MSLEISQLQIISKNIPINFVTGSGAAKILKNLDFKVQDVYNPPSFIVENGTLKNQQNGCGIIINTIKTVKKFHRRFFKKTIQIW